MALIEKICKNEKCGKQFLVDEKYIKYDLKVGNPPRQLCSKKCQYEMQTLSQIVCCKNCNIQFSKMLSEIKRTPNHFCSQSCAATFNNKNKKTGTRRSKLEVFVEEQLNILYPNLNIVSNGISQVGYELDFYFPELKAALEINGVFHYQPIYGEEKLKKIKKNDRAKKKECKKQNITLYVLKDTSSKFTKKYGNKFIKKIIRRLEKHLTK